MTPEEALLDLDELEKVARAAAEQVDSGNEWDRQHGDALSEFEAAIDPSTVLALIEAARLGMAAADHLGDHWCDEYRRDHTSLVRRIQVTAKLQERGT